MRACVNGVEIFFEVDGYGLRPDGRRLVEKPVMFVLHGGPGFDHSDWVTWLRPLTEDLQLVYVDHRGNGRSSRPPLETCTPEAMADDLEAVRQHLGLGPVLVFGASFGGMVALSYAIRHADALRGLIVSSTAPSGAFIEEAREIARRRATPEQLEAVSPILDGTLRDEAHLAVAWPIARPLYYYRYDPAFDATSAATIRNVELLNWFFSRGVHQYDVRRQLGQIAAPTLVLTGRHDFICPPSQSAEIMRGIPRARQVIFERSGHLPHKEEQAAFLGAIRSFVLAGGAVA